MNENKKYVFITGATSGIGKACAYLFAESGFPLVITGRRMERLEKLKIELNQHFHNDIEILCFDVQHAEESKKAIASLPSRVKDNFGILINNAGLAVGRGSIEDGMLEDWNRMIDTNIKGILHVSSEVIPFFKNQEFGHIFNLGSIAGKEVYPGGNVYCATKHAVDALSKAMRVDLAPYNIKVTNIAPGAVETEFSLVRFKGNESQAAAVYDGFEPLKAEDVADAIFYAATRPKHVTINDLVIMPTAQASSQTIIRK